MKRRALLGGIWLVLLGCGSSSPAPFTANGTIGGVSLKAGDAVGAPGSAKFNTSPTTPVSINAEIIVLSNSAGLCASATAAKQPKTSQFLTLVLSDQSNVPTGPGTHTIWAGTGTMPAKLAFAQYDRTDANCASVQPRPLVATSGTVTITSISGNNASASFDLTFDSTEHITGSFSASNCAALIGALISSSCG
jgi:hypothetical protein